MGEGEGFVEVAEGADAEEGVLRVTVFGEFGGLTRGVGGGEVGVVLFD